MTLYMRYQNWRAGRILKRFAGYVNDAADLDQPAIERRNPEAHAKIKARVGWRLLAKNGKGRKS